MGKRKSSLPTLTPRRKEVLEAIQAHPGASQREIARIVGTAPGVVSTVISLFLPNTQGKRTMCLGPGPDHYFMSPDPRYVKFCPNHRYLTQMEEMTTYGIVTRRA